ncbi:MAG: hypothetical protein AVDCRST_MAG40-2649 [uncultured Gemmatimonadaceae bacterium]|uniref:Uncharacterized protein n=1 Tax=uncultured Gemmatimonadaceae bacterium TaxID=246130 RepID=A0A6J4M1H2_9BACT|nr:MAG: hypothetical protein AVDCRST_MAG40-2649 [uncultured Gemmatimonadaceae bacterium]
MSGGRGRRFRGSERRMTRMRHDVCPSPSPYPWKWAVPVREIVVPAHGPSSRPPPRCSTFPAPSRIVLHTSPEGSWERPLLPARSGPRSAGWCAGCTRAGRARRRPRGPCPRCATCRRAASIT